MRRLLILLVTVLVLLPGVASAQSLATDVESKIAAKLIDAFGDDAKAIRITWVDGKAILTGKVVERSTQELAEQVALYFNEVSDVDNQLKAEKDRSLMEGQLQDESLDAALETEAKGALASEIGSYAKDINVEAAEGVVALRGTVPDATRHKLAIDSISKVKGATKVIDLLRVK